MALYIPITDKLRQRLIAERARTGVGPTALMRGSVHDADRPKTLKGQTISLWLSGKIMSARRSQLDYVLARWAALPDASNKNARAPQERTILSEEHLRLIDIYWDKGLLPNIILENKDALDGLNAAIFVLGKIGVLSLRPRPILISCFMLAR